MRMNSSVRDFLPHRDWIGYNKVVFNTNHFIEQNTHNVRVNIRSSVANECDVSRSSKLIA